MPVSPRSATRSRLLEHGPAEHTGRRTVGPHRGDSGAHWLDSRASANAGRTALTRGNAPVSGAQYFASGIRRARFSRASCAHFASRSARRADGAPHTRADRKRDRQIFVALKTLVLARGSVSEPSGGGVTTARPSDIGMPAALYAPIACTCLAPRAHERRSVGRFILGSVAESIVRTAPCPVLVVRDPMAG